MPKSIKDSVVDLEKNLNREKLDKRNLLLAHKDEDNSLKYQFHKYNKNNHSANINGCLGYKRLKLFNTKIRKISDILKDTYGITVVSDHTQCA